MSDLVKYSDGKIDTSMDLLRLYLDRYRGEITLACSFSIEDTVLIDMIMKIDPKTEIFTIDTGRLPEETYRIWEKIEERYKIKITPYFPNMVDVESMIARIGINGFYYSLQNRKECCRVRKIEPLKRALKNKKAWICGLRKEQGITRENIETVEQDENGVLKINPLADWTFEDLLEYSNCHDLPLNELYQKGYTSIGCEPCTRVPTDPDDPRSGRWWWEDSLHKECGLHIKEKL